MASTDPPTRLAGLRPWQRLHAALMPDYNRRATAYWWLVVGVGALTVGSGLHVAVRQGPAEAVLLVVGALLAMLSAAFPVRIRGSKNAFTAGEVFVMLLLFTNGPAAAAVAAAAEAAVGAGRASRRWTSRLFSPATAAIAITATGALLDAGMAQARAQGAAEAALLPAAAMVAGLVYFALNTLLVSAIPRLKRGEWPRITDLVGVFGWVGMVYAGSAVVAALLYLAWRQSGIAVVVAIVPMLGLLLAGLHVWFRHQETAEAAARAAAEAAAREAELAERHVRELQASERRFHSAFTHASIGMALLDRDGTVRQANRALRQLLGADDALLLKRPFGAHVLDEDQPLLDGQLARLLAGGADRDDGFVAELRCRHQDGHVVWVSAHCSFFGDGGTDAPCLILQAQDVTARRRAEASLHHLAFHDGLTGLPNRRRFHELLAQVVAAARADPGPDTAYAVMFLDFDRFKLINDSLGHEAGDDFLVEVARRLASCARPQDTVARLGGDEFAVLLRRVAHPAEAIALAESIQDRVRRPFLVARTELASSASIGITFSAFGYDRAEDVLRDADTAMYKAKSAGKARYALFDASLHTEVSNRLRLEGDLRQAVAGGQLSVAYQPMVELGDGRLRGFEALVRWTHPRDGAIAPADFLPIAQEAGLMMQVTDFVLTCACRQLARWRGLSPAAHGLHLSVNVSGHDIAHPAFVARVSRALVESGLPPGQLTLELTEDILMSRLDGALPVLENLRRLGVALAVDDFGTGYSSLSHLATLPIDMLKVDRSFVSGLSGGGNGTAVVESIVLLGRSLGKAVVAEGIETASQFGVLQEMGCRLGQGFHIDRPLDVEAATARVRALAPSAEPASAATSE